MPRHAWSHATTLAQPPPRELTRHPLPCKAVAAADEADRAAGILPPDPAPAPAALKKAKKKKAKQSKTKKPKPKTKKKNKKKKKKKTKTKKKKGKGKTGRLRARPAAGYKR